jgi:hypothetical protein
MFGGQIMRFKKGQVYRKPTAANNGYYWFRIITGPQKDENGEKFLTTEKYDHIKNQWFQFYSTLYMRPECLEGLKEVSAAGEDA